MRYRLPLIIILAAAMAALAAGCGRSGSKSSDADGVTPDASAFTLASASTATSKARSAKLTLAMKMSGDALRGHTLEVKGDGAFDLHRHRGELTLDMGGVTPDDLSIDEVIDGTTLYMRAPFLTDKLPSSAEWLKLDMKSLGQDEGIDMTSLMSGNGIDPAKYLDQLKATSGSLERTGTENVRGTETTRYHAVVEYDKLPDTLPAGQRAAARKSIENIEKLTGLEEAPIDVWVDGRHRVRRIELTMDIKPTEGQLAGQTAHTEMTMDLYDFGTPVDVELPSPSQTQEFSSALGAANRSSLSSP